MRSVAAGPEAAPLPQVTGYLPSISDLMIASVTGQPFNELKSAIQSKDVTAFAKAYADLTDACNSCHQALNHGVVEIAVPSRTSASDLNISGSPGTDASR